MTGVRRKMASRTFRTSTRFCVDACKITPPKPNIPVHSTDSPDGLERLFRLVQSVVQLIAASPVLLSVAAHFAPHDHFSAINNSSADEASRLAKTIHILLALKDQLGLIRKFFRTFRFLDAFHSAYTLASSRSAGAMPWVTMLDIMAKTFKGMYLFLETATLIDAMGIDGLSIWAPTNERFLKMESQRSWFFALLSGAASFVILLLQAQAEEKVLQERLNERLKEAGGNENKANGLSQRNSPPEVAQIQERIEVLRLRIFALTRKLTANCLDLALPGSVVGWIPASSRTVALCMFATSILTGWDVWERCGREVAAA